MHFDHNYCVRRPYRYVLADSITHLLARLVCSDRLFYADDRGNLPISPKQSAGVVLSLDHRT